MNEARLREAQAIAHVGSFHWDAATNHVTWTDELYRIYGLDPSRFAPTFESYIASVHPDSRDAVQQAVQRALSQQMPFEHEYRIVRPDGVERWVFARGRPVLDSQGKVAGLEGICQDITDRKLIADEYRRLASFREAVIHTAAEGVCVCHAIPDPPYTRFVLWNERMVEITGYTMDEVNRIGWPRVVFPDPELGDRAVERQLRMRAGDHLRTEEWVMTRKDSSQRTVAISTSHVEIGDGLLAAVALMHDVTERKRAEADRRRLEESMLQAQKLESLGVLAGGIAHDFNNLLTSMLGFTELARNELPAGSKAAALIREAERAARQAAELTQQILAYAGRGRFVIEFLDLSALVRDMVGLMQTVVSRQAEFRLELTSGLPAIEADGTQVRQVVMNLVTNAAEALPDGRGTIRIRTGSRRLDQPSALSKFAAPDLTPGEYVFVEVSDTGCGMDAETIGRIFDPFFTTKFTGRGLGLAAALGIIRGHKGLIQVQSTPRSGACFEIFFPSAKRPAPDQPERPSTTTIRPGSGVILVIEDEPSIRQIAKAVLERGGYKVAQANDGRSGLALYETLAPNLTAIMLDLTMPYLNGMDVLQEIRRRKSAVPIIVMTGYNEEEIRPLLAGAEPIALLRKPFNASRLLEVLQELLAKPVRA